MKRAVWIAGLVSLLILSLVFTGITLFSVLYPGGPTVILPLSEKELDPIINYVLGTPQFQSLSQGKNFVWTFDMPLQSKGLVAEVYLYFYNYTYRDAIVVGVTMGCPPSIFYTSLTVPTPALISYPDVLSSSSTLHCLHATNFFSCITNNMNGHFNTAL